MVGKYRENRAKKRKIGQFREMKNLSYEVLELNLSKSSADIDFDNSVVFFFYAILLCLLLIIVV